MLSPISFPGSVLVFSLLALTLSSACSPGNGLRNAVFCGNNHIQAHEECDDGVDNGNNAQCTNVCQIAFCGDGLVLEGVEVCDDGSLNSNIRPNSCREDCTSARCGDGIVDSGEACDDGNTDNFDNCSNVCARPECGNDVVEFGEECDDGNTENLDECTNVCTRPKCGNDVVESGEECDDGNLVTEVTCDYGEETCSECSEDCSYSLNLVGAYCGDGLVDSDEGEVCDDGEDNGSGALYCRHDCSGLLGHPGMVVIPAGDFIYGPEDKHETLTTDAFLIDTHEVTASEYMECAGCYEKALRGSEYDTYNKGKENHPVNYVSWHEAVAYCAWKDKRLPTEVEWEKAARGTDGRKYPWGDEPPACDNAVMKGCEGATQPVGGKESGKSPYGVYDMAGNVWEWTNSWVSSGKSERVLRGGSFYNPESPLLSSGRGGSFPTNRNDYIGFRCARSF